MRTTSFPAILMLLTAACGTASSPTSSTAPTPTTPAPTSTVTSTTVPATTTSTIPPAVADSFLIAGNTCMLGWWDGEWQSDGPAPVNGGEEYQIVRLDEPITLATGTELQPWCDPLDLLNVQFDPALPGEWNDTDAIAVQTTTDVRPHDVELLSTSIQAYIDATSSLLQSRVAGTPEIDVDQVIRTDLEGDGVDEVIVAASTMPDDPLETEVDDYTILYLRKLLDGNVETAILGVHVAEEDGPFGWVTFEVAAVADLNGDGLMEIVVGGNVWEGGFLQVFEWFDADLGPIEVLECGCGA